MLKNNSYIVIYGCGPVAGVALAQISRDRKLHGIGPGAGLLQRDTPGAATYGGVCWMPKEGASSEEASMTSTANSDKA
ncbi:MAG: hypothetical protein B7X82_07175 [Hydrogenophilales bacterium 17-64-65]|nr:MAG: hypothetical protein B7Y27_07900 [Hydrogenophilales bacterium 16-64-40]OZA33997.1 MAG: hypothetical protein B7X82_07175 [Hydrogenophilales bacterium 17-64-65]